MEIVEFKVEHLEHLKASGITDKKLEPILKQWTGQSLEAGGETYTLLNDNKEPVMIGGIKQYWFNRGEAWVIFGKIDRVDFVRIHNLVQRFLDRSPFNRVEAVVEYDFFEGHRWARTLGFKKEADFMDSYHADGRHATLYARVINATDRN
jgi:hypothetical protein